MSVKPSGGVVPAISTAEGRKGVFRAFTAVDLIAIAVFALLLRFVFLYIYKALYVVFPWNQAVFPLFMGFCMAAMLVLVPKPGATTLWTIAWQLINFFLQGEDLTYILGYIPIVLITELVFWLIKGYGADLRSVLIGTMVYTAGIKIWDWIALNYIFLMPYALPIFLVVTAVAVLVANNVGAYAGFRMGKLFKRLLG